MHKQQKIYLFCSLLILAFVQPLKAQVEVVGIDILWEDGFETESCCDELEVWQTFGGWTGNLSTDDFSGDDDYSIEEIEGYAIRGRYSGSTFSENNDGEFIPISPGATGFALLFRSDNSVNGGGGIITGVTYLLDTGITVDYIFDEPFDLSNYSSSTTRVTDLFRFSDSLDRSGSISSTSHPDQYQWFNRQTIYFGWEAIPGADYYLWEVVSEDESLDVINNGEITTDLFANTDDLPDGRYRFGVYAFANNEYVSLGQRVASIDSETSLPNSVWVGDSWSLSNDLTNFPRYELDAVDGGTPVYYTNKTDSVWVWLESEGLEADGSGFSLAYVSVSSEPNDEPIVSDDTTVQMLATDTIIRYYPCDSSGIYVENGGVEVFSVSSAVGPG